VEGVEYLSTEVIKNKIAEKEMSPVVKLRPDNAVIVESWKTKLFVVSVFLLLMFLMINVNYRVDKTIDYIVGAFATVSFMYLLLKLVLSFFYKPAKGEPREGRTVSVIMPSYNENADSVIKAIH